MTGSLFQYLISLTKAGERVDNNKLAAIHISKEFNVSVTENDVLVHLEMWRTKWDRIWQLTRTVDRQLWNGGTNTVVMAKYEERAYVKACPWAEGLINRPIAYYNELAIIFGSDIPIPRPTVADVSLSTAIGTKTGLRMSVSTKSNEKSATGPSKKDLKKVKDSLKKIRDEQNEMVMAELLEIKRKKLAALKHDMFVRERDTIYRYSLRTLQV